MPETEETLAKSQTCTTGCSHTIGIHTTYIYLTLYVYVYTHTEYYMQTIYLLIYLSVLVYTVLFNSSVLSQYHKRFPVPGLCSFSISFSVDFLSFLSSSLACKISIAPSNWNQTGFQMTLIISHTKMTCWLKHSTSRIRSYEGRQAGRLNIFLFIVKSFNLQWRYGKAKN